MFFRTNYTLSINVRNVLVASILLMFFVVGCGSDKTEYVDVPYDRETLPSMSVDSVTELISDSGLIRYKLITDKWLFFDNAKEPHWFFPEGLYLEQFDSTFQVQATLIADTVWNFTRQKLWRLKGNVFIENAQEETFESDELFWNEKTGKVYSDKYIEINRPGKIMLRGIGFESNQEMTEYHIFKPHDTDIYVEESNTVNTE